VGAAGLLAFMALQIGALRSFGKTIEVKAAFSDAAGLSEGAVVSVAGVSVGRVESLRVESGGAMAVLSIDADAGLREDVRLAVRARSVLGEKYVELTPMGDTAPILKDGGKLVSVGSGVEIDQLVTSLGPLVDALDPAALAILTDALKADPERATRMLNDAERLLHNAAVASDALPEIAEKARSTLASVEATSDQARPLLTHADQAITQVEGTVTRADALLASVSPAEVDALFDDLSAAAKEGRVVIEKVNRNSGKVERLLDKADGFTRKDWLRITQEEGILIRLSPRDAATVLSTGK
jgi:phospholipid/cholesterol/gamma-HCH transport system substrate-binding protein